jgi:hypothetical protein
MLCLSVRQPWAWAITSGAKKVENRSWPTDFRGLLLIHAAASTADLGCRLPGRLKAPAGLVLGALVGAVVLADVARFDAADFAGDEWAQGPWCWALADPRPFAEPVACKGRLGLWAPPASAALRRQLRAAGLG